MATAQADADNAAAPLDQLLVDVGAWPLRRWLPGRPGVEFIASLAGKPRKVGRRVSTMVAELDRVVLGRSAVEPKRGDRRSRCTPMRSGTACRASRIGAR
jgi:polyhydroxyalkanoate synthase subunit PhaC